MDKLNSDIQRIISLSFEKIAVERIQRGGVKLHRGLMLANVIYNAKHLAVNKSKKQLSELSYPSSTDASDSDHGEDLVAKAVRSKSRPFTFQLQTDRQSDKNFKRKSHDDTSTRGNEDDFKKFKLDNESNYSSSNSFNLLNSFQMCHLNSPSKVQQSDASIDQSNNQHLQYTTLNTAQLSVEDENEDDEEDDEMETSLYTAEEDLSSCSTQIREALDMLSRPVISLTV